MDTAATAPDTPPPYVARSPADLIALVPYLLGFHPEESLVLLTFGDGPSFHARVDLPDDDAGRHQVVEVLLHALRTNRVPRAAVVVFSREQSVAVALVDQLSLALGAADVHLIDAVRADGGHWWSLLGGDPDDPHPYDLSSHPFTADRVFRGQVALASRSELVAGLRHLETPEARSDTTAISVAADRWADQLLRGARGVGQLRSQAAWLADRVGAWIAGEPVSADDAGHALTLLFSGVLRDIAWVGITRDDAAAHVELWRGLVRRAPDDLLPPAAAVLAWAAWMHGDGALAWCAIDRCREAQRALHAFTGLTPLPLALADRVVDLLQGAVSPTAWQPSRLTDLPLLADLPLHEAS